MPANGFNIGSDTTLSIISNGAILNSAILTSFEARQMTTRLNSKGINGVNLYSETEEGWEGTFSFDRADSVLDDYFATKEANRYAGLPAPSVTITETTINADSSIVIYRYDGVTMKFESAGSRAGDSKIEERVTWASSRRIKVQ